MVRRRDHGKGENGSGVSGAAPDFSREGGFHLRDFSQSRMAAILSCFVLAGGIATLALAAYLVFITYSRLPWSDGWIQILVGAEGKDPLSLSWLWRQHNEHRLLIPKLFLVADLRWFHARQAFLLASIFAIQLFHWMLLGWSMRALGGWCGPLLRTGLGVTAFCLFCPSQWENLVWGFQTCFVLPGFFATLSFAALLLYQRNAQQPKTRAPWMFLLLSVSAAFGATVSLANGMLLWPLLVLAAWLLQLRKSAILTYGITGTLSALLYFHDYSRPAQNSDPLSSITEPARLIEYVAAYFGSSWVRQSVGWAVFLGIGGLLLAFAFLWCVRPFARPVRLFAIQLTLILCFCLGTACITAPGRISFGIVQAFASRYQTVALLFWCCLGLLLLEVSAHAGFRYSLVLIQLALIAILVRGATLARFPMRDAREHAFQMRAAGVALITGVEDREQIASASSHPDTALGVVPYMREKRLSVFAGMSGPQLGSELNSKYRLVAHGECEGELQSVSTVPEGGRSLRIAGWAWSRNLRHAPSYIVVVANGRVIGLGAVGDWRPQIRAAHRYMTTSFIGFTAYAKHVAPTTPMEIYGVFRDNSAEACPIAALNTSGQL